MCLFSNWLHFTSATPHQANPRCFAVLSNKRHLSVDRIALDNLVWIPEYLVYEFSAIFAHQLHPRQRNAWSFGETFEYLCKISSFKSSSPIKWPFRCRQFHYDDSLYDFKVDWIIEGITIMSPLVGSVRVFGWKPFAQSRWIFLTLCACINEIVRFQMYKIS